VVAKLQKRGTNARFFQKLFLILQPNIRNNRLKDKKNDQDEEVFSPPFVGFAGDGFYPCLCLYVNAS
jgi:hypothetical protein